MTQIREETRSGSARRRRTWHLALLVAIGAIGCSSEPQTPEATTAEPGTQAVTEPTSTSQPVEEKSEQRRAAEIAFHTMTTENITPPEWEAANQKLQEIGQPALPVLVDGLQSSRTVEREMASTVLAWFGIEAEPVAEDLVAALDDDSSFVRANVATALLQMPDHVDRVVPVVAEFLQSDDADLRRMAAMNLAAIEASQARPLLPHLIDALGDGDRDVVYYSTQLLGRLGRDAEEALPALRALETGSDQELKTAIDTAILQIESDQPDR